MDPQPTPKPRQGYVLVGFVKSFWHVRAKKRIVAPPGKAFPIWRKVA